MAQVFENFGAQTTGNGTPSGWTLRDDGTNAWTLSVVEDGAALGGKYLRFTAIGGDEPQYLAHTASGSVSGAAEVVTKWRIKSTETNTGNFIPIAVIYASGSDLSAYALTYFGTTPNFRVSRLSTTGASAATLGTATPFTPAVGTWYGARFQVDAAGVFRARVWDWSGAEPGTWDITTAADTTIASGLLGIGQELNTSECEFDLIGIGTGGDPAPTSAGGGVTGRGRLFGGKLIGGILVRPVS